MKIEQNSNNPELTHLNDPINYNNSPSPSSPSSNLKSQLYTENSNFKINYDIELSPIPKLTGSLNIEHQFITPKSNISSISHKKKSKINAKTRRIRNYFNAFKLICTQANLCIKQNFINEQRFKDCAHYWITFSIIANVFGCVAITIALIASRINHLDINVNHMGDRINSTITSIQAATWMDIEILNASSCPQGYVLANMGAWPGTIPGCISYNSTPPMIQSGVCDSVNGSLTEQTISPLDSIILNKWKGHSFCVRLAQDYYFAPQCKAGYVQCSFGMCYNEKEFCPISNIFITNEDFIPDLATTKINMSINNNGEWLYYKNEFQAPPIVGIGHSFYRVPCNTYNSSLEMEDYPLIQNNGNRCETPQNSIIDIDIEKSFYSSNSLDWLYDKLPGYINTTSSRLVFLNQQSKIQFNQSVKNLICYNYTNFDENGTKNFINFDYYINIITITYGILHFSVLILVGITLIMIYHGHEYFLTITAIFSGLVIIPDTICFTLLQNARLKAKPYIEMILNIEKNMCFDDIFVNNIFLDFSNFYTIINYEYILCIAIFLCSMAIVIPFIFFCFNCLYQEYD